MYNNEETKFSKLGPVPNVIFLKYVYYEVSECNLYATLIDTYRYAVCHCSIVPYPSEKMNK